MFELLQVNQVAQFGFVATKGNSSLKWRVDPLAQKAPRVAIFRLFLAQKSWKVNTLSADNAVRSLQRAKGKQAGFTDWNSGNSNQRGVADTAIGREESEE